MAAIPDVDEVLIEEVPVNDECDDGTVHWKGGSIAMVTINRPNKLNALNNTVVSALKQTCQWVEENDDIRMMIIQGSKPEPPAEGKRAKPKSFVAGADISEFVGKDSKEIRKSFEDNAWEAIWNLSKPTIAMVDGFALGGGLEVALSCDLRIVSEDSRFATPEINLGLIPGGGGTQRLSRLVGYGKAMEMVMGGEMINAEEALAIGLVNHVHSSEKLEEATLLLARNIASKSPHTLKVAKATIRAALEQPLEKGISIEADAFAGLFDSEDKEIGVKAFLERKDPEWVGR